tara:strand:+ start:1493 stop:3190 length:1698 start_codon:yes stop_codon:yes gene_type:complete
MANIRKTFNFREGVKVDDNVLVVAGERVGIGTTVPSQVLDVRGRVTITGDVDYSNSVTTGISTFAEVRLGTGVTISSLSGIITATSFYGDGSNLDNIPTSQWGSVASGITTEGSVGIGTTNPQATLQVGTDGVTIDGLTGNVNSTGIITASTFVGSLTGYATTATLALGISTNALVNIAGVVTATSFTGALTGNADTATTASGLTTNASVNTTGVITATSFSGSLTGNADTATTATTALGITTASDYTVANITAGIGSFNAIGIGTSNPATDIEIINSDNSRIRFGRSTTSNGLIGFGNTAVGFPYSSSTSLDIANYGTGNFNFYLEAGGAGVSTGNYYWHRRGNFSRLMTLTNAGTLGLGVTTPISTLHVVGTSTVTSVAHFGNDVNVAGDITTLQGLTAATISLTSSSLSANLTGNVYAASGVSTFSNLKVTGTGVGIGTDVFAAGGLAINSGDSTVYVTQDGHVGVQTNNTAFDGIDASQTTAIVGTVGIGTTVPSSVADFGNAGLVGIVTTNRFIIPPKLTNTQRGQIAAPQAGALIYNTNANRLQFYTGTEWLGIATAAL